MNHVDLEHFQNVVTPQLSCHSSAMLLFFWLSGSQIFRTDISMEEIIMALRPKQISGLTDGFGLGYENDASRPPFAVFWCMESMLIWLV